MKTAIALGVLLAAMAPVDNRPKPAFTVATPPPCANTIVREPVLVYELAGSTLIAQIDRTLYVYGDGTLKLAQADADSLGFCKRTTVNPRIVLTLQQKLMQAGAMTLCDDVRRVTDVPLHTMTMMEGAQDAKAHTFSYWLGDGEYAAVDALLEEFVAEQFP